MTLTTLLTEKMPEPMRIQWFREEVTGAVELKHLTDYVDGELAVRNRFKATGNAQSNQPNHNHHHQSHHDKKEANRGIRRSTTSALHSSASTTRPAHKVLP